ncbi:hypothetical protein [Rhodopirellula sallentina]|uniref:hypothetical protein n=1 Tax=Rhodopirellula sallentina TaxID=1263869 RepID=UPI001F3E7E91|nr:hypothetical protein [Rhodopirellula sallentina]
MTQLTLFSDLATSIAPTAPQSAIENTASPEATNASPTSQPKNGEQDTLLRLAQLIRNGRDQMEAQSRVRSRPVQSIGDLAQAVLLRHDLVARRRAAAAQATVTATRVPTVGLAQTPAEVHVAS